MNRNNPSLDAENTSAGRSKSARGSTSEDLEKRIDRIIPAHRSSFDLPAARDTPDRTVDNFAAIIPDLVDFAGRWIGKPVTGIQEGKIRDQFNMRPVRFYQLLHRAIETPEALEHDPVITLRLRDQRDRRAEQRVARTYRPTR